MRNILKIASLLDQSGQFRLSDKLFKIAQNENETDGNNNFAVSTEKNDAQWQADKGTYQRFMMMNTSDPRAFVKSLFDFGSKNGISNLTQAFDAYANAGASYQGNQIKNVPVLKELYMRVRNTPRMIGQDELVNELSSLAGGGQGQQGQVQQGQEQQGQPTSAKQSGTNEQGQANQADPDMQQSAQEVRNYINSITDESSRNQLEDALDRVYQEIQSADVSQFSNLTEKTRYNYSLVDKYITDPKLNSMIKKQVSMVHAKSLNYAYTTDNYGSALLKSNNSQSFVNNLYQFMKFQNTNDLLSSFDDYADAGATFNGQSIKNIPAMQQLYKTIKQTPRMIYQKEMENYLNSLLNQ